MEITITHCRYAPKWETLEKLLREVTNEPDSRLTKIVRPDRGCGYREPGVYNIDFERGDKQTILPIKLTVVGVGHRQEDYETTDKPGEK